MQESRLDPVFLTFNLRFPGQYYDSETGLNYNYFRDYEPGTGRYLESDPLGLFAASSTYGYVGSAPLRFVDSHGLFQRPMPCLTTEDCACIDDPANCPKPIPAPPPIVPGPGSDQKECKDKNCANTYPEFQECDSLPFFYRYSSKEQAARAQGPGARAVRRQPADPDKGECLQPGGHWRIEIEGAYIGYSVIE
jgi:RHS repeat-associated protein